MSLKLIWTNDATAYADYNLQSVVFNVLHAKPETFQIGQVALLDAFRLAIASDLISHSEISLDIQGTIYTFNHFGNFVNGKSWPVTDVHSKIICDLLGAQVEKKRAAQDERPVD